MSSKHLAYTAGFLLMAGLPAQAAPAGRLVVEALSFRNSNGSAACALYSDKSGFPGDPKAAIQTTFAAIHDGKAVCTFTNVPTGTYAVAVFHDENNNKKLDTNFIGIPKEGVGVSNDARGFMGPPPFDKSKFSYPGGELTISLHMKYL